MNSHLSTKHKWEKVFLYTYSLCICLWESGLHLKSSWPCFWNLDHPQTPTPKTSRSPVGSPLLHPPPAGTHTHTHACTHKSKWANKKNAWIEKQGKHANIAPHSVTSHIVALQRPSVALVHTVHYLSLWLTQHLDNVKNKNSNYSASCLPPDLGGSILSLSSENNSRYQSRRWTEKLISTRDDYHRHMRCHSN